MSDGLSLANGPSEQMGDVGLSLVDPRGRGHVYAAASCGMRVYSRWRSICQEDFREF